MADYYVGVTTEGYLYNGTDLHTYNTVAINQTYRFTFYNYEVIDNVLYGDGVLSNETDKVQVVENHYVPSNSGLYVFWMLHNNAHAAITQKSSVNSRISTTKEEDEAGMTRVASHVSEEETVHTSTGVHESESVHVSSHPSESVHTSVHTSPHTSVHVR
jgi:hypothetical protein